MAEFMVVPHYVYFLLKMPGRQEFSPSVEIFRGPLNAKKKLSPMLPPIDYQTPREKYSQ